MKAAKSLLIICIVFTYNSLAQQITVDNTISAESLIENTLIQGCVEVSNINSPVNGSSIGIGSYGYFEKGNSNFPFENGIVLSSGDATSAGNTLNTSVLNEGNASWGTDNDLENTLGISGSVNATTISFNFISITNYIEFNYILASEEYFANFPCNYSDGFAFLIREANSGSAFTNIAVIPNTNTPVNTTTIHDEIVGFCEASNPTFFEGYNIGDTNYNGRTSVLTASANIMPNTEYEIKLIIADQTDQNYDSAVFIEGNSFNTSIDLGDDFSTCANSVSLNGDIGNPLATYTWYYNDIEINNEIQPILNVTTTGNYRVEIEIPLGDEVCILEDNINVSISSTQSSDPISDFEVCDDLSNDGLFVFDLESKTSEIEQTVPASNYLITYHYTSQEAINNENNINNPIENTSNPQLIYVRIEDINNGCLAYSSFNLVVNSVPEIINPSPLEVCDDTIADGITSIDLSIKNDEITNNDNTLFVTYHLSSLEASTGENPLEIPYTNSNSTETLFVRVTNPNTNCFDTTILNINVLENPIINTDDRHIIDACDTDHDGFSEFNLNTIIPDVLNGLSNVNTSFHLSYEDALSDTNPIENELDYNNIIENTQIVFMRVEDNSSGCASVAPIELHTNMLLTATNITDFSTCDINNDGIEEFFFDGIATTIINNLPNVSVNFYLTVEDRDNSTNPIDTSVPFIPENNPHIIYIELLSQNCREVSQIALALTPIIEFEPIENQTVCDEDQDGLTSIDLTQFTELVTSGQSNYTVTYFITEEDALSNSNPLSNTYTNLVNPVRLYTRIRSSASGCADVNSFEVTVLEAPVSSAPNNILICDDDQDGFYNVNLNNTIPEIVTSTIDREINFYTSQSNAINNTNPITNLENFNAETQTIHIRVENTITGCFSIENFQITVNTLPIFTSITPYIYCENNSDGIGEFIFASKDAEILNNQIGKQTSYYASQEDANNRTNSINKNLAFSNTTNPQTIYVRVENNSDSNCFDTSSFEIEVGSNPEFNEPTDWFVCDDMANDGFETFDLSEKINEITQGLDPNVSVTFYTSQNNAINSINPLELNYTNTVNPQQIYFQVDNGTICNSIGSFELNVIQVPMVNPANPITLCENDYDQTEIFDITQTEVDILDVRQDDVVITYFESEEDANNNSNSISNPESYQNSSNPQTVYAKVSNEVSDCFVLIPIDLMVQSPPAINPISTISICENEEQSFDLNLASNQIVTPNPIVEISYFGNLTDAENNENALNPIYNYTTNNDTIFARVLKTTSQCYIIHPFNLQVNPIPEANQANNLEACDDDEDGLFEFNLNEQSNIILGSQDTSNLILTYHNSINDAIDGSNTLEINYFAFNEETIYARVENSISGCYAITSFNTIVYALPNLNIGDQVICRNNFPLLVSANTNNSNDSYLWSTNAITPEIEITETGTYWVTVTSENGCETTEVFSVSESESATIVTTEIIDFSDPNNVTVTITGIGNYLYQIDDEDPQESNIFDNVGMGYHTITIIDLNGCAEITKEILVMDIPKHLSPNNDGQYDTWHIVGVEQLPGTRIQIFDRYGKLLHILTHNMRGWDGTYNGKPLPASDYWFLASVVRNGEPFEVKGHFTLRR